MSKIVEIRFNFKTETCPINELFDRLKTYSGNLSVVYLDVSCGEILMSYGEKRPINHKELVSLIRS